MQRLCFLISLIVLELSQIAHCHVLAQTEGNQLFGIDQVLKVDVNFYDDNFWTLLNEEYNGDQNYIPAAITIASQADTTTLDSIGIRLKGNSSMMHPGDKKPFKVDFNRYITGQNYDLLKKLNFNNGFKDPTFVREKIFYDACESAGLLAPRATFAEVSFNGVAWGFYTVVEQIDDQFLDRSIGDDGGMLFKAGSNFDGTDGEASLVYLGSDQTLYANAYEPKDNVTADWSALINLIDFINNASDEDFENQLGLHLDLPAFLRSAAFDNLFANLDSYTLSARNYYLYQNLTTGLWQWIKWDANEAFGSYAFGVPGNMVTLSLDFDGGNQDRPLLQRILSNNNLKAAYDAEMCDLRELVFNSDFLIPRLNALKALIQDAVYADDNKMFSNADFESNFNTNLGGGPPGGGGGGTLYGLFPFIESRADYVDANLNCSLDAQEEASVRPPLLLFPNPAGASLCILGIQLEDQLRIWNASGELIHEAFGSERIQISDWPSGMYLIQIQSKNSREILRFLKS